MEKEDHEEDSSINVIFSSCEDVEETQVYYTLPLIFDDEEGNDSNCFFNFDETLPSIFDEESYFSSDNSSCDTMFISSLEVSHYPLIVYIDDLCDDMRMITNKYGGDDL